ncbi:MAG: glucose-1-phosphate adenylyltransferase, partial [Blastococcus sp.]|nr:glucose-1-phosphate adenylyltransferase [Blastococcus sp.]
VEGSVVMDGVVIGEGAVVRRAILDKNAIVPPGARIGVDAELDRERYHVSAGGVTVLGKGARALL